MENSNESRDGLEEVLEGTDDIMAAFIERVFEFIKTYKTQLMLVLGLVVAGSVGTSTYFQMKASSENKAADILAGITGSYSELVDGGSSPVDAQKAVAEKFATLQAQYADTDAGLVGKLYYADICFNADDMDAAKGLYSEVVALCGAQSPLGRLALRGQGYIAIKAGDSAGAVEAFSKLTSDDQTVMGDEALFQLGEAYQTEEKISEMNAAFEKVVTEYPSSMYAGPAKISISG